MRVWIDLSNSPHALLFAPIVRVLERSGDEVIITARDNAQTVELARERWPEVEVIGEASPPGRAAKAAAIVERMRRLRKWAIAHRPDVALSHNSYAQLVAARSLGIRAVTAMDYEFQPANHVGFRAANMILLPEALPLAAVRRQGADADKTSHYPGLKEHIQLADFVPDPKIMNALGIDHGADTRLVLFRTPPSRAIYHQHENPVFAPLLHRVAATPRTVCVVLARHPEQREQIAAFELARVHVPDHAVDTRSLMYLADAVIGAGGTMTREAALLGVPTFSVFSGRRPAVDRWLEDKGLLTHLSHPDQCPAIRPRQPDPRTLEALHSQAVLAIESFVEAVALQARA